MSLYILSTVLGCTICYASTLPKRELVNNQIIDEHTVSHNKLFDNVQAVQERVKKIPLRSLSLQSNVNNQEVLKRNGIGTSTSLNSGVEHKTSRENGRVLVRKKTRRRLTPSQYRRSRVVGNRRLIRRLRPTVRRRRLVSHDARRHPQQQPQRRQRLRQQRRQQLTYETPKLVVKIVSFLGLFLSK